MLCAALEAPPEKIRDAMTRESKRLHFETGLKENIIIVGLCGGF